MISVMIVDDEIQAIEYLESLIDWERHGYKIVSKTTDGASAVAIFDELSPDVVISDISMPGVSGLDISSELLARDPYVQIILLTAYSDFVFAQEALNIGVMSYILKHDLEEKRLLDELAKARRNIEKNADVRKIITRDMIRNYLEDSEKAEPYSIRDYNFDHELFGRILLFTIVQDKSISSCNINSAPAAPLDFAEIVLKYKEQLPQEFQFIDFLTTRSHAYNLLFRISESQKPTTIEQKFEAFAGVVLADVSNIDDGISYSGFICWSLAGFTNITSMYKEAVKSLDQRIPMRRSELLWAGKMSMVEYNHWPNSLERAFLDKLGQALSAHDYSKAQQELLSFFVTVEKLRPNRRDFADICSHIDDYLAEWYSHHNLLNLEFQQIKIDAMGCCYSLIDMRDAYLKLIYWLITQIPDKKYESYSSKIKQVVKYIYERYADDLSVDFLADMVNLSSSRLSRLFKAETDQGVLEYLTVVRIQKAKELLQQENAKIYEVSEEVGYKTSQYFSQVFKRITGLTPNEYREQ